MSGSKVQSYVGSSEAHLSHTSFTWTIDKFSYRTPSPYATSPIFTDEEKNEFRLRLCDSEGFLCLSIIPTKLMLYRLDIKYKVQLDASVGLRPISFEGFGNWVRVPCSDRSISTQKIISHEELLKRRGAYLQGVKDTLTIHCEIFRVSNDKTSLSTVNGPSQESVCKEKTLADYGNLLKSGKLADVKLIVGGKTFSAHKSILSARSPVFAAMFVHDTLEKQKNQVKIPDVDPEVFGKLLEFLYTGAVPILANVKSAEELLIVSDKYDCDQLKGICEDYLATQLTIETAPNLLLLANSVNATKLKETLLQFIRSRGNELFAAMQNEPEQMINMFQYLAMKNEEKKESK